MTFPPPGPEADADGVFLGRAVDVSLRVGGLAVLLVWCFAILRPFLQPLAWAVVLAVALHTPFERLRRLLGGRGGLAAALLVLLSLGLLLGPAVALTTSVVDSAAELAGQLREGTLAIPPPPARLAAWPVVGKPVSLVWDEASRNLESVLTDFAPQLRVVGTWILTTLATTGAGLVKFLLSLVIAGVLLARSEGAGRAATAIATRLTRARGVELAHLAAATVQSVTRGILGVALIQALLAGLGMLVVGVPAAGLWALLLLIVAVMQLPTLLVLAPVAVYVFARDSTVVASLFAVWSLLVGLLDNILKPIWLGRGLDVPMVVIFLGAIGGFLLDGIIGLFLGAVVLAVSYRLFQAWLEATPEAAAPASGSPPLPRD